MLRVILGVLLLAGSAVPPGIVAPAFKVLPFNRVTVEGSVMRIEHCDDGNTRATAIETADDKVTVSAGSRVDGTGFVMRGFALTPGEQLVGVVCGQTPRLVLRSGDAVTDALVTKTGATRQPPYHSLVTGISVSRAIVVSGQLAILGADLDGTAAVGFVDEKMRSMLWTRVEGVAGTVSSLYPGVEKGSWIGVAASLKKGDEGGSTVFFLKAIPLGGVESKTLAARLPLVRDAGCGPGCLAYIDLQLGSGSVGPVKVLRSDGVETILPVLAPEWSVTSSTLVEMGDGLCVLDTTPEGFGCRGGEMVTVARETEFVVGPAATGPHQGLGSVGLLVRSMATPADVDQGSQVVVVRLELKKP